MENYFNTQIIARHDDHMMLNNWMAEHYDFCLTMPWNTDEQNDELYDLKKAHLCFDI